MSYPVLGSLNLEHSFAKLNWFKMEKVYVSVVCNMFADLFWLFRHSGLQCWSFITCSLLRVFSSVLLTDSTLLQVLQEATEHLSGLHPGNRLHDQSVWLFSSAGILQVDGLRCLHLQGCPQPAHPLHQHVSLQL